MTDAIAPSTELLSTTSLAKTLGINSKALFHQIAAANLIVNTNDKWELTDLGKANGGQYQKSTKFGQFIVWPKSIIDLLEYRNGDNTHNLITATTIGKRFNIPANRINSILSELGWIRKDAIKGWHITELGKRLGGVQSKYDTTGISFARWPKTLINNTILISTIREASGDTSQEHPSDSVDSEHVEFRDKFKPKFRATDGHFVRSKAEVIVDNWLYVSKIVHAFERKLPIEEELYCDFYIPTGKVYIEFWGSDDETYLARKKRKLEIYRKYNLNLIELDDKDVSNIDDKLPAKLLEFGIPVE